MQKLFFTFLLLLSSLATYVSGVEAAVSGYCERHPKKIIRAPNDEQLFNVLQTQLARFVSAENLFNNRYELCFDILNQAGEDILPLPANQKLTLTNNTDREVVIGFLKARRTDDSTTPILEIRGRNVTVFAPEIGNVKKAFDLRGNGHKIIQGNIRGMAVATDSTCVYGNGNKMEFSDLMITDCPNAIHLIGNENNILNTSISFSRIGDMPKKEDYNDILTEAGQKRFITDFRRWREINPLTHGICISGTGQGVFLSGLVLDGCHGTGLHLIGSNQRISRTQVKGEILPDDIVNLPQPSGLERRSSDCLLIKKSSNILVEANEISNCHKGIHIQDSQQIYIGPEQLADFESKHNKLHHNDYAIHAQNSQQVFAWHNSVYENGAALSGEEEYHFGLWLDATNFLESVLLKAPTFVSVDPTIPTTAKEVPVVRKEGEETFIEVKVPTSSGTVELTFPQQSWEQGLKKHQRHQPHLPFVDCSFENVSVNNSDGYGKIRCPIQVTEDTKDKKVLAVVHADNVGSSPISETLGVINPPTGIPVSAPAPDAGNMSAEAGASGSAGSNGGLSSSGEVVAVLTGGGSGGGGVSGGGGGGGASPKAGCQLNHAAKKVQPEFFASVIILFVVLGLLRKHYGVG